MEQFKEWQIKRWALFFVDVDGHAEDDAVASALGALEKESQLFRVLGSYPKAIL